MDPELLVRILTLAGLVAVMLVMGLKVTLPEVVASCKLTTHLDQAETVSGLGSRL
jgi:hypothetical protein